MFAGNSFRAVALHKIMLKEDCYLSSQLMLETDGHDLTVVLSASALLDIISSHKLQHSSGTWKLHCLKMQSYLSALSLPNPSYR